MVLLRQHSEAQEHGLSSERGSSLFRKSSTCFLPECALHVGDSVD